MGVGCGKVLDMVRYWGVGSQECWVCLDIVCGGAWRKSGALSVVRYWVWWCVEGTGVGCGRVLDVVRYWGVGSHGCWLWQDVGCGGVWEATEVGCGRVLGVGSHGCWVWLDTGCGGVWETTGVGCG